MTKLTFLLFSLAISAVAQVSAGLSGTVTDQSGGLVSAAVVTVKNPDTGAVRSTVSDSAGRPACNNVWGSAQLSCP